MSNTSSGKGAFITGANKGIGLETARGLPYSYSGTLLCHSSPACIATTSSVAIIAESGSLRHPSIVTRWVGRKQEPARCQIAPDDESARFQSAFQGG
jgi:hypothetical protein